MSLKSEFQKSNLPYLLVAFLVALGLWYTLNAREEIERVVDVRIDYKGLPPGLIVTGGQINKVSVRFRGPKELLRSMTTRELSYTMDLSGVTAGRNVIPLTTSYKPPELRAYEVLEVTPSRMILEVDKIMEKSLPVKVTLRASPAASSVTLKDVVVEPKQVTVRGPAAAVASLKDISAEVPVDLDAEGRAVTEQVALLAPPSVEIMPQTVTVTWRLDVRRRTLSLQRDVLFEAEGTARHRGTRERQPAGFRAAGSGQGFHIPYAVSGRGSSRRSPAASRGADAGRPPGDGAQRRSCDQGEPGSGDGHPSPASRRKRRKRRPATRSVWSERMSTRLWYRRHERPRQYLSHDPGSGPAPRLGRGHLLPQQKPPQPCGHRQGYASFPATSLKTRWPPGSSPQAWTSSSWGRCLRPPFPF